MIKINSQNKMDGIELLKDLDSDKSKAVFFDPQYRGILDKLKYGMRARAQKRAVPFLKCQMKPSKIFSSKLNVC
jgi:hypothetical protein